jgi:hypothetical protein
MKKLLLISTITLLSAVSSKSQILIDPIMLIAQEDTSTRFVFNNTKLMAGDSVTDRYLVYYNSDTIFLNVNQSGNWTRKTVIISSNVESATMTLHNDTIWVCWKGGAFIRASYSTNLGNSWTAIPPVSPGGNVAAPSIFASSNGKIHFVWSTKTPTDTIVYHRVFFNGSFLTNPYPLSNPTGKGLWPSVIAVGDTVLCSWKEEPLPTKVWFASSYDGGNTWTSPDTTSSNLPIAKDPNLAYAFDNSTSTHYLYLAYDSQDKIYLQRSTNFGITWSSPQIVSDPNKLSQFAHLECNNSGFVGISYEHRTGSLFDDTQKDVGFVYSTSWAESGSFGTDTLAYTHNPFGSVYPAFNKIDENNFYLVWLTKDTVANKMKVFERRVYFNNTTGINYYGQSINSNINIFPNPALENVRVKFSIEQKLQSIKIYSVTGELLQEHFITEFSVANLPCGIYFVITQTDKSTFINKLIKQ